MLYIVPKIAMSFLNDVFYTFSSSVYNRNKHMLIRFLAIFRIIMMLMTVRSFDVLRSCL